MSTRQSTAPRRSAPRVTFCAVLVSIPVIAALSVPLYQRTDSTLGVSGLVINLVVTAVVCGIYNLVRDGTVLGSVHSDDAETDAVTKAEVADDTPERVPTPVADRAGRPG